MMKPQPLFLSIIITTYNRPSALRAVLESLIEQNDRHFEVIIADDGSDDKTAALLKDLQVPFNLVHVWQHDKGFRAAKIRNKAVARAQGNYIVFLDGDCVPFRGFIQHHRKLAETGWFVAGNRVLLSNTLTEKALTQHYHLHQWSVLYWMICRWQRQCNRWLPLLTLPLGPLRKYKQRKWRGVKTCNLGVYKNDFIAVNGFEESYTGWGYEDSDLVIRLLRYGLRRKEGRFAVPVLHLWHAENDRTQEKENLARLKLTKENNKIIAEQGFDQYHMYF